MTMSMKHWMLILGGVAFSFSANASDCRPLEYRMMDSWKCLGFDPLSRQEVYVAVGMTGRNEAGPVYSIQGLGTPETKDAESRVLFQIPEAASYRVQDHLLFRGSDTNIVVELGIQMLADPAKPMPSELKVRQSRHETFMTLQCGPAR